MDLLYAPLCTLGETAPPTGDPAVVIAVVAGVCAVAMIVLSVLSKRGKGGRR